MNNQKFWTEFIEIYYQQTCLWDVKCVDYLKKHKRMASYNILLEKLKQVKPDSTVDFMKKKINNMRTAFRREYKKVQDSLNSETIYEPTLWYYDLMLFVAQSETDRRCQTNDVLPEDIEIKKEDNTIIDESDCEDLPYATFEGTDQVLELKLENAEPNSPQSSTRSSSPSSIKRAKLDRKAARKNKSLEKKKKQLLDLAYNALSSSTNDDDENEYLLMGKRLGCQLKGLEEKQRFIAEKLMSDVMFFARMGRLTEDAVIQFGLKD